MLRYMADCDGGHERYFDSFENAVKYATRMSQEVGATAHVYLMSTLATIHPHSMAVHQLDDAGLGTGEAGRLRTQLNRVLDEAGRIHDGEHEQGDNCCKPKTEAKS